MKYIGKIAFHQNIRNETPNRELAKELCEANNIQGIKEISEYLFDKNKSIASDCLAVMYEIGYQKPELIADYLEIFLELLQSKNNRMVWGAMIAIANISTIKAKEIYKKIDLIIETAKKGTLITEVWGIKVMAGVSLADEKYKEKLFPLLSAYLERARPVDFSARLEVVLPVLSTRHDIKEITKIAQKKKDELSDSQTKKMMTIINKYNKTQESSICKIDIQ